MSDKIGDVYDGGRKIGELHRSNDGCLAVAGLLLMGLIGGMIVCGNLLINQARYGATNPIQATVNACNDSKAVNQPSTSTLSAMAKQIYEKNTYAYMRNIQRTWVATQRGCAMEVCVTFTHVPQPNSDSAVVASTTGEFDFVYDVDVNTGKLTWSVINFYEPISAGNTDRTPDCG